MADRTSSPEFISAFETAMIDTELLFMKLPTTNKIGEKMKENHEVYSVVISHIFYRSAPTMSYSQEYQKGPLHMGKTVLALRGYAWTKKQIDTYVAMKRKEDFNLLASVDGSVKAALEALGDELERYLQEAGEKDQLFMHEIRADKAAAKKKAGAKEKKPGMFASLLPKKHEGLNSAQLDNERAVAKTTFKENIYKTYKFFKKKDKMLAW